MSEAPRPPGWGSQPPYRGQRPPPSWGQPPPPYQTAYSYPPQPLPPRTPWRRKWWVWTTAGIAVFAIILVAIGVNSSTTPSTSDSASASTHSTQDEWLEAVCKPGTFRNGGREILRNADGQASCSARLSGSPIILGQYSDEYMARNDVTALHMPSAIARTDSGDWEVFISFGDPSGRALEPLAELGFTVTPGHLVYPNGR